MSRPVAITNARLVDPASGYDGPGAVVITEGVIADVAQGSGLGKLSADVEVIDAGGALLIPGLVDIRVKTGEPGFEPKETLKSAAQAAAAGGVTTMVLQPDTHPVMDEPAVVDFVLRRARPRHRAGACPRRGQARAQRRSPAQGPWRWPRSAPAGRLPNAAGGPACRRCGSRRCRSR